MTYNKEARITELKALSRTELHRIALNLGVRIKTAESNLSIARKIEEREFQDHMRKQKMPLIREIF